MGALMLPVAAIADEGNSRHEFKYTGNPLINYKHTADPAIMVLGDTLWMFTGCDEPGNKEGYHMPNWCVFSTTDMINWTEYPIPIHADDFKWNDAHVSYAGHPIKGPDGKYYFYTSTNWCGIGVSVSDRPEGPYKDVLGKPLLTKDDCKGATHSWVCIDPVVFIDDDGQPYIFWGNNGLWYAKLNRDMISLGSEVMPVSGLDDPECFGPKVMKMDYQAGKRKMKTGYEEGPWVFKRNGIYYIVYAAGGVPEHMAYSTSSSINGPWKYQGRIMDEAKGSFTIHGGSIEIGGRNFMFYHDGLLPNGGGFRRSTSIEEFNWDGDKIPFIPFTKEGVTKPLRNFDPYQKVSAPTMAESYGLKTDRNAGKDNHYLTSINNGDWLKVRSVDFGNNVPSAVTVEVSDAQRNGTVEFYLDNLEGRPIAKIEVTPDSEGQLKSQVKGKATGVHDLLILFRGDDGELFNFKSWQFLH